MNVVAPYDGGVDVVFSAIGYDESLRADICDAVPDENLPHVYAAT